MLSMDAAFTLRLRKLLEPPKLANSFENGRLSDIFRQPVIFCQGISGSEDSMLPSAKRDSRAPVAQWIEHLPSKQGVAGSSPAGGARLWTRSGSLNGATSRNVSPQWVRLEEMFGVV